MATSTTLEQPRLGWIGLGSMGLGMALNLQKHLSQQTGAKALRYHNRTISRGEPLQEIGGAPAPSVRDLVATSDILFLSLSDDAALAATVDVILTAPGGVEDEDEDEGKAAAAGLSLTGKTIVDTSTVHPSSSETARSRLAERGAAFVAAPVFGASPVAREGKLLFVLAGPEDALRAIEPYLVGVMGRAVIRLGEDVKKASMLKTAGNFVTAAMMEVVAEAHVLAEKTGLGTEAMECLFEQQYGPLALSMSKRMTTGAYMPPRGSRPWSDLNLAVKDVGHGIDCGAEAGARLPVGELVLAHLGQAREVATAEGRELDPSSSYGVVRKEAGLAFATELVQKRDASLVKSGEE